MRGNRGNERMKDRKMKTRGKANGIEKEKNSNSRESKMRDG